MVSNLIMGLKEDFLIHKVKIKQLAVTK